VHIQILLIASLKNMASEQLPVFCKLCITNSSVCIVEIFAEIELTACLFDYQNNIVGLAQN